MRLLLAALLLTSCAIRRRASDPAPVASAPTPAA